MLRAKQHVLDLPDCIHGGTQFSGMIKPGMDPAGVLDFSTCLNPYGPPRTIESCLQNVPIRTYPDPESTGLIKALAGKLGAAPSNLIAGSGSTELIRLVVLAYLGELDQVVTVSPTYSEYELACRIVNANVFQFPLQEENDFRLDAGKFIAYSRMLQPAAIFLCNPNNPTGQYMRYYEVAGIVKSFPDSLIVLDEAYISFTAGTWDSTRLIKEDNIFIIRSMTKDFALAGLRLGYGMASPTVIESLKKVRPPWNVSSAAQHAGALALDCSSYISRCNAMIRRSSDYLVRELSEMGYNIVPSQTNFFMLKVGNATAFQQALLNKGFIVRNCTSFGLPDHIRIAPRRMQDCRRLIKAIRELKG